VLVKRKKHVFVFFFHGNFFLIGAPALVKALDNNEGERVHEDGISELNESE
jgi:hypothetical protein